MDVSAPMRLTSRRLRKLGARLASRLRWQLARRAASTGVPGLVSVIVPVHNRAGLLIEAVESVLAQTYRAFEVIVVDDGSTDDTVAAATQLASGHPQVRLVRIAHTGRVGLVREAGRRVARGEFLQYLDSDDLIAPRKLELLVRALHEQPWCDIAYCATRRYAIGGSRCDAPVEDTGIAHGRMLPDFLARRFWYTSTPIYRRWLCDAAGAWGDYENWEDYEMDMRMAVLGARLCHRPELLTDVRDHGGERKSAGDVRFKWLGLRMVYCHGRRAGIAHDDPHMRAFLHHVYWLERECEACGYPQEADQCRRILRGDCACPDPPLRRRWLLG